MKITGWCPKTTTPAKNSTCSTTSGQGTRLSSDCCTTSRGLSNSLWKSSVTQIALNAQAKADFQPKFAAINGNVQPHFPATMTTGGAAKGVRVPPIDTFTSSTPRVIYCISGGIFREKMRSLKMSAPSVMVAGSVINDPSNGTTNKTEK